MKIAIVLAIALITVLANSSFNMYDNVQKHIQERNLERAPQSVDDIRIDIVDSRTDKDMIQIIIYYMNCTDRLNLKKNSLENFDKLQKAVDQIIEAREKTGGC